MAKTECNDLATKIMKIHAVSEALTHGWYYLEPERRAESLAKLKKRVNDLIGGGIDKPLLKANVKTAQAVIERIETLEQYNKGEGTMHDIPEKLVPTVVEMAVESILDCGCRESGVMVERDNPGESKPTRDKVRVEVWEERDRLHIGIQDKVTGDYYASWWDDDAREMFEDGFFKPSRLEDSVLEYAEEMGILAK